MNSILTATGEYKKDVFTTIDKPVYGPMQLPRTYMLVGTRSGDKWQAIHAVDTFRCVGTSNYIDIIRATVYERAEAGLIK